MTDCIQSLGKFLVEKYSFSTDDLHLLSKFVLVSANKNEILTNVDITCHYAYFICNGCLRTYFIDEKGEEKTRYIAFENKFVSAFASFITQKPSTEYVQALEKSQLLKIKHSDFYNLVDTNAAFSKLYRHSLEQAHVFGTWRMETMISMNAKERYENLLNIMPHVIHRLSNKVVASFLGITQESLSRLKSRK
jgi:CRP-like cAMP-binding protein